MWAVIDVETTGLYWKSVDRIIEVAIVQLDERGRQVDAWETLLDPDRDLGPTSIHGITGRDVTGAPRFDQVADEILWRLSDRIPVGHNVRFDLSFLTNEFNRLGFDFSTVRGVCTMDMAGRLGAGRSLVDCCSAFDVPLHDHHTACADAVATGALFGRLLGMARWEQPPALPAWPRPMSPAPVRTRRDPPPSRVPRSIVSLAHSVGVPNGIAVDRTAALSYFDLLDRVLEDRQLTLEEVTALASLASDWGISEAEAERLHRAYIGQTWKLAEADGVVTRTEVQDIENLADLLGVAPTKDDEVIGLARDHRSVATDWTGLAVCFTGDTQCCVDGVHLRRDDLQAYAEEAGMIVKDAVSGKLDLLVLADPDSRSGKAKKADQLGLRKIYDVAFLRALGVACDAGGDDDA